MEEKLFHTYLSSPAGLLKITSNDNSVVSLTFCISKNSDSIKIPPVLQKAKKQLQEYFEGKRKKFTLPLQPAGTEFQLKVWELIQKVEFGKTASYLEIAKLSGSEKNTRAVGLANGKNPIPIIIPCHRIIGSNGKLTGYSGGLDKKKRLLLHELENSKNSTLLF